MAGKPRKDNDKSTTGTPNASPSPANTRTVPIYRRDIVPTETMAETPDQYASSAASVRSTETVRRVGGESANIQESYGSLDSVAREQPSTTTPAGPATGRMSRTSSRSSLRVASLERKPRRPTATRRASSAAHPHKGQEFSAEDELDEVEEDQRARTIGSIGSSGYSGMRRRSQVFRRRNTQPLHQCIGDDEDSDDEDDIPQRQISMSQTVGGDELDDDADEGTVRGAGSYAGSEIESDQSFTLKDRQQAINQTHPFGIRIWKPALYKKNRSVQQTAEGDIHSAPGEKIGLILLFVNMLWVLLFGWWMFIITAIAAILLTCCFPVRGNRQYGRVLFGLAYYLLYPFGRFVELKQEEAYAEEDEGEGRSISEYEQWQAGDIETGRTFFGPHAPRSIVGRRRDSMDGSDDEYEASERTGLITGVTAGSERSERERKTRLFGRGQWSFGRVLFYVFFYILIAPMLLIVSGLCWLMVFWIPMAKVTHLLFDHLRRHPLALSFHSDNTWSRRPDTPSASILLCTYRAVGWKYYKYTVDGTNIFFINLLAVVVFVIVDYFALRQYLGIKAPYTEPGAIFTLALCSVIPLAYYIGQAVASISAQSSMGMGATINAFFSTIVEVYLYCVALSEGKGRLVEGSVVGSIFAGVVFMPGLSMCSGAIKRKTQRFNAKSAGVTSTMLLFAIIAAFAPTLFYQIYGTYELSCRSCIPGMQVFDEQCRRCSFSQTAPTDSNEFYKQAIQPYTWISAIFLFLSYVVGLWFTLRTHAAVIWQVPPAAAHTPAYSATTPSVPDNRRHQSTDAAFVTDYRSTSVGSVRDSQLYNRILGQSLKSVGLKQDGGVHRVPPRSAGDTLTPVHETADDASPVDFGNLSPAENAHIVRATEIAAAAATAAVHDVHRENANRRLAAAAAANKPVQIVDVDDIPVGADAATAGGHDAPNWSKTKSAVILLAATISYAVIAEILVNTVDVVLENFDIDEKFLGFTLFALVPNTTEFLNAISFAMNGNIALSMEIGSAYTLQVCLLQIPALVLFSAYYGPTLAADLIPNHTFSMIFPQWDLVTVILCVFLLSYMYGEGKSNYFKGTILILSYITVMMGFYFGSFAKNALDDMIIMGAGQKGAGFYQQYGQGMSPAGPFHGAGMQMPVRRDL
ncbi:Similar to Low affinity vacuolar monovalent cation/H(+) antiporter; acc. no. P42839 [Pyronema omphalodes CBS 100304]|uniref:Similar to Low affinity vacuolar monovalent cation/H(+) antiporter acc. no. P42839 n=1 Tax=Pyronema omphalodes (strain CBS 100304) TaxID=1076935 RepID=U4LCR0_PYROM|nr:Similar to Low affinity vacuolar monovalent cation/H(+) antiporter; acc. no. P42839 [Pyronema omphalodes CBS 100304]